MEEAREPFCCPMRSKFILGIVAESAEVPTPLDAADFMEWDLTDGEGRPILRIKFCPFCGKPITGPLRVA